MGNGLHLEIQSNVGDKEKVWMTPTFLSWEPHHCHSKATREVENTEKKEVCGGVVTEEVWRVNDLGLDTLHLGCLWRSR